MTATILTLLIIGFYPYLVYPIVAWLLAAFVNRDSRKGTVLEPVTVVIAAYNEEECIRETVENKLTQEYPEELLRVIVVSDGSTDMTDRIVANLADSSGRVSLLRQERQGKTAGLNRALDGIESGLVIFSDANSIYAENAVRSLVSAFADESVGYVSGKMVYGRAEESVAGAGSGAYMRYENFLRQLETRIGSIVGVDGGIDAIRRELYRPMRPEELPDFSLPLAVVSQGRRVVYEPSAVLFEDALRSAKDEFSMRVRVSARAIWTLLDYSHLLNPIKRPLFAFQLFSHKWLRYFSFLPLSVAYVLALSNATSSMLSLIIASLATMVLLAAILGLTLPERFEKVGPLKIAAYFLLINVASAFAFARVLSGKRVVTWKPRVG